MLQPSEVGAENLDLSPIPVDHWAYREADWVLLNPPYRSVVYGTFPYSIMLERPYVMHQLFGLTSQVMGDDPPVWYQKSQAARSSCTANILDNNVYRNEYDNSLRFRTSPYSITSFSDTLTPLYRFGVKQEVSFSWSNRLNIFIRGRLENKGDLDTQFGGRKWKKNLTGYFDYGLITYRYRNFILQYGRTYHIWGPGDVDRLLLSDNSPAFDQIGASFTYKWLKLSTFITRLDDFYRGTDSTTARYLAGHRLMMQPVRNLQIGLSETVLFGRQDGGFEWYYANPILPYYWEQWNNPGDDNVYMGLDFIWWPVNNTRVYGEFMIDDFQIDFESEANQVGFDLGFSRLGWLGLNSLRLDVQYTQIRDFVYSQVFAHNLFTNHGVVIGSSLGPDGDRTRLKAQLVVSQPLTLFATGTYRRKGEGRVTANRPAAAPRGEKFPSGTVEKTVIAGVGANVLLAPYFDLTLEGGYFNIDNRYNVPDRFESPYALIRCQIDLQFWLML